MYESLKVRLWLVKRNIKPMTIISVDRDTTYLCHILGFLLLEEGKHTNHQDVDDSAVTKDSVRDAMMTVDVTEGR
jgi:hypothetical protein